MTGGSDVWIRGVARTPYGVQPGTDTLGWQVRAARAALDDADLEPGAVDGLLVGYSTTTPHLMPANAFAERLGIRPAIALGASVGGATGLAMVATASALVQAGRARRVLVVAGEDRASGRSRAATTATLADVGHPDLEVPLGATVPAYYGLLASRYLADRGLGPRDLAALAVPQRVHASRTPGAQFTDLVSEADVLEARMIANPLTLLQCCPVSDGGAAILVSAAADARAPAIVGLGSANRHQHLSTLDPSRTGAGDAAAMALGEAGISREEIDVLAVYDSFTVTLAMILEETGFVAPGMSGASARGGRFGLDGDLPLNTHGGLMSYGHCGVAGGLAHLVEAVLQLRHDRPGHQVVRPRYAYVHAEGGVLSAHVALVLRAAT
ncbi:thiolase family protein [Nocardioides sp. GXZ039]|uniref:thiolase family protein n=1 Tax=Nocardioides sp. GXZ039 TaxID=3136018 RepID=UPI0030F40B52